MNLKKFTYQGILLILGGLLLILILAAVNLQPLISAAWNSHSLLKEQSSLIENADRILLSQSKELKKLEDMIQYFKTYADKYEFDYLMIAAQAYQESGIDQSKRSPAGAIGVMQLLPSTAADPGDMCRAVPAT